MSDIVERLRAWVYTDSQYATAREAADEIERLRGLLSRTGTNSRQTGDDATECHSQSEKTPERERLTDAEREAVEFAYSRLTADTHYASVAATLRALLERTK